ncbi:DUF7000 family protein [Lactiplantibacillus daowaiensis]|uniref:DUF7000 family protein n=1 Tax=Lactiplantibacillus daowaiensis TaxID=2559918 RepID=A0ABW1S1J5_9LACO|nr:hypothetical protein [Lactiplantibacillus daowaiensis]
MDLQQYQAQLQSGELQRTYKMLVQYVTTLKRQLPASYQTGNLSLGYLDYTYVPFFNASLRVRKLRFGLVLNHAQLRLELWLMGQNAAVTTTYYAAFKASKWHQTDEPQHDYAIVVVPLCTALDFDHREAMTAQVLQQACTTAAALEQAIIQLES